MPLGENHLSTDSCLRMNRVSRRDGGNHAPPVTAGGLYVGGMELYGCLPSPRRFVYYSGRCVDCDVPKAFSQLG